LRRSLICSTVGPTQQRTKDLWTEGARFLKEGNGPTTPKELLYSKINRQNESDRTKKGATSADVLRRKQDRTIKGRMVYDGKPTREWLSREDSVGATAALESIMLTSFIDAHEERNVMTCDIPNAFIQALMPEVRDGDERVMMKITGVLIDMLAGLNPDLYGPYVYMRRTGKYSM
jgi:hypothetical protein